MKEHHIGIIVKSIEKDIDIYEKLGYRRESKIYVDEIQKNKVVFLYREGNDLLLELIEPIDRTSTVYTAQLGYHHICYEVNSDNEVNDMYKVKGTGIIFLRKVRAVALKNRCVSFAMLQNGFIVEYLYK